MIKLFFTFFILLSSVNALEFSKCEDLASDCEYYSCVEETKHCGKNGYALGFGRKYCKKFERSSHRFSESGKMWIEEVKECLIDNLGRTSQELSCNNFRKAQVKNHIPCYVNSGYCSLNDRDKFQIKRVVYKTMWRPSFILSALKILTMCH